MVYSLIVNFSGQAVGSAGLGPKLPRPPHATTASLRKLPKFDGCEVKHKYQKLRQSRGGNLPTRLAHHLSARLDLFRPGRLFSHSPWQSPAEWRRL